MPNDPAADFSPRPAPADRVGADDSSQESQSLDEPIPELDLSISTRTTNRFRAALCIYLLLASLAWFTLDGVVREATLVFIGGIAFKSWLAVLRARQG